MEVRAEYHLVRAARLRLNGPHGFLELLAPVNIGGSSVREQPPLGYELFAAIDEAQSSSIINWEFSANDTELRPNA